MAKINLVRGFTLRKRLRKIIDTVTLELRNASTFVEVSNTYPNGQVIDSNEKPFEYKGKTLAETYEMLKLADKYMITLNNLIDEANMIKARPVINELEIEKNKIAMLRRLAENRKNFSESVSSYDMNYVREGNKGSGGIITTKYKLTDNIDWENEYNQCNKNVMILEDKLSELNSTTTFELPDEILNFIKDNI